MEKAIGLIPRLIQPIVRWVGDGWQAVARRVRNTDVDVPGLRSPGGVCSFSADTLISTTEGKVPISEVETGDTVHAYHEATGEVGEYTVTRTHVHDDPAIAYLTIDGEVIETTPNHPSTRRKVGKSQVIWKREIAFARWMAAMVWWRVWLSSRRCVDV